MTGDNWTTIRVRGASNSQAVIAALFALGAEGVQELDSEVVTHLREADADAVRSSIAAADRTAVVDAEPLAAGDYTAEWRARVGAHRVGRLVITPPWLADGFDVRERIVIEPAMAFGTGEHETTRGVLRLMQDTVRAGDHVADLGAGSAVLSIAAARLGARRVVAIESDADAIGNAEWNVSTNDVGQVVTILEGDARSLLPLVAPVRVVLANIISSVLLELLSVIAESLSNDGAAILSGILVEERPDMEAAFSREGWRLVASHAEGAWWSASIVRA